MVYRCATNNQVPVLPQVQPGFNDRSYRLPTGTTHTPLAPSGCPARALVPPRSTEFFRCVAIPEVEPSLPIVMVTSWDDWNEDTGIEPIPGKATTQGRQPEWERLHAGLRVRRRGYCSSELGVLTQDIALLDRDYAQGLVGAAAPAVGADCNKQ